jgi:hypothetical protein
VTRIRRLENLKALADLAAELGEPAVAACANAVAGTIAAGFGSERPLMDALYGFTRRCLEFMEATKRRSVQ